MLTFEPPQMYVNVRLPGLGVGIWLMICATGQVPFSVLCVVTPLMMTYSPPMRRGKFLVATVTTLFDRTMLEIFCVSCTGLKLVPPLIAGQVLAGTPDGTA